MTQVPPTEKEEDLRSVSGGEISLIITLSAFNLLTLSFPCRSSFMASSGASGAGALTRSRVSICRTENEIQTFYQTWRLPTVRPSEAQPTFALKL